MSNTIFTYDSTVLTFATAGHLVGDTQSVLPNQVSDVTLGGVRMTGNLGSARNQWQVTVILPGSSGSQTNLADVLSFLGTGGINYGVNSFTWTDGEGTERTVNLVNDTISIESLGAGWKKVSFQLEQVNS